MIFILIVLNILLTGLFLYNEAKTFMDYANCIYFLITATAAGFDFTLHVHMMQRLFQFITNLNELIQKSKMNQTNDWVVEIKTL